MSIVPRTNLGFFLVATPIAMVVAFAVIALLNEDVAALFGSLANLTFASPSAILALALSWSAWRSPHARITPAKSAENSEVQKEATRQLASRNTYVIWSTDSRKGFDLTENGLSDGLEGLIISRKPPATIKSTYGIKQTAMIWLTTSPGTEAIHPANTGILTDTIVRFLAKGKNTIVLLDGFESIVTYTDFRKALMTLDHLKDLIVANDSRMIVPIDKRTLSDKEAALVEKKAVIIQG
jgi:hypothetical protein